MYTHIQELKHCIEMGVKFVKWLDEMYAAPADDATWFAAAARAQCKMSNKTLGSQQLALSAVCSDRIAPRDYFARLCLGDSICFIGKGTQTLLCAHFGGTTVSTFNL
jgi:hypothetical protein